MNRPANFPAGTLPIDGPARFTTAEFVTLIEHAAPLGIRLELLGGELARMSPPMSAHSSRQLEIASSLFQLVKGTPRQAVVEIGIDLGNDTVLVADVAVTDGPIDGNRLLLAGEVALVVEVTQTTVARDLGVKRLAYAGSGIAHYWVVDGDRGVVHVYGDPVEGVYADVHTVRYGQPLPVPGIDATIVIG